MAKGSISAAELDSFANCLRSSDRILALLGAGLSASSGLPTFRGAGGIWRRFDAPTLATPEAFHDNHIRVTRLAQMTGLVWQFYSYRRHMALAAQPNKAHYALAELAKKKKNFLTLSQNVDGLSPRAGHPASQLHLLHGSLFDVRCTGFYCKYSSQDFTDPIVPELAIPTRGPQLEPANTTDGANASESLATAMGQIRHSELDISDADIPLPVVDIPDLPTCPTCHSLLRPGVVWFGESLPKDTMAAVQEFITESEKIDLIMVIGTSARVYPAAGYVDVARQKGARVAVVNLDRSDVPGEDGELREGDFFFEGDAGMVVPEILKAVIGEI